MHIKVRRPRVKSRESRQAIETNIPVTLQHLTRLRRDRRANEIWGCEERRIYCFRKTSERQTEEDKLKEEFNWHERGDMKCFRLVFVETDRKQGKTKRAWHATMVPSWNQDKDAEVFMVCDVATRPPGRPKTWRTYWRNEFLNREIAAIGIKISNIVFLFSSFNLLFLRFVFKQPFRVVMIDVLITDSFIYDSSHFI